MPKFKDYRKGRHIKGKRGPKVGSLSWSTADPLRQEIFLKALRDSGGSYAHACQASAPHLDGKSKNPPAFSSWKGLEQRDPHFAAKVAQVRQEIADDIEREMHRRSVVGVDSPVFQKAMRVFEPVLDDDGNPVLGKDGQPKMKPASVRRWSDSLLLARARAIMPDKYNEKREINVNVNSNANMWSIGVADLEALSDEQQNQLAGIMQTIRSHRKGATAQIEYHDSHVEDAEFDVVAEEDEKDYADFDLGENYEN